MIAPSRTKKLRKSAEQWLLDRSTLRRIQERTSVNFSGKWKQAQKYAKSVPSPLDHLKKNTHRASKILLLDGKYVKIRGESVCIHIAFDTGIGVIDFWIDDTENKTAYGYILRRLRETGYEPICCVSDEHGALLFLLEEMKIPHQFCIFHLLKNLRKMLATENQFSSEIPKEYQVMYSRMKGIFKTSQIEDIPDRVQALRKLQKYWNTAKHQRALAWFYSVLPNAIMGLSFEENIPKTTNQLENINGQIEQRLKTFRGVKSELSLRKTIKILLFFRNYK